MSSSAGHSLFPFSNHPAITLPINPYLYHPLLQSLPVIPHPTLAMPQSPIELLERSEPRDGWITVSAAFQNRLAVPFQVHRSEIERMTEDQFLSFVGRQAESLIEQFGDARQQRIGQQ